MTKATQTATVEKLSFAIRARLNGGADVETAVLGAIRECGPLRTVRVSSAQAKGAAKQYPYWGAARYNVVITREGRLSNVARERASSDRRSVRLAEQDCTGIADREGRAEMQDIGSITAERVAHLVGALEVER